MFKPKLKLLLIALLIPMWCFAQQIQVKETAPERYVVKQGDTLWDISSLFLNKPWLWPELWRTNTQILNPHLIYPGDVLILQWQNGQPVIVVNRPDKRQVSLSPSASISTKIGAIPLLPWSAIAPYLNNDTIMSAERYERLPHILGNNTGDARFVSEDIVLAKARGRAAQDYAIVRQQNEVFDRHGNLIGVQVRHVADGQLIDAQPDNGWLVRVEQSNYESKRGDRLYEPEQTNVTEMQLQPVASGVRGEVVGNLHQRGLLGKHDVVIIDLGENDVQPGTVMGIYMQGPTIYDGEPPKYDGESGIIQSAFDLGKKIEQPAFKTGELVVFKTFDKASYAMITRASELVKDGAIVGTP